MRKIFDNQANAFGGGAGIATFFVGCVLRWGLYKLFCLSFLALCSGALVYYFYLHLLYKLRARIYMEKYEKTNNYKYLMSAKRAEKIAHDVIYDED